MKNLEYNGIGHSRIWHAWEQERLSRVAFLRLLVVVTVLLLVAFSK